MLRVPQQQQPEETVGPPTCKLGTIEGSPAFALRSSPGWCIWKVRRLDGRRRGTCTYVHVVVVLPTYHLDPKEVPPPPPPPKKKSLLVNIVESKGPVWMEKGIRWVERGDCPFRAPFGTPRLPVLPLSTLYSVSPNERRQIEDRWRG